MRGLAAGGTGKLSSKILKSGRRRVHPLDLNIRLKSLCIRKCTILLSVVLHNA